MNIKSLLIGSAAALVAVSGARAADAVMAPEPEPVEYVRVCDAYGAGFFYIPGTETCLKISGYVWYQIATGSVDVAGVGAAYPASYHLGAINGQDGWFKSIRARVNFDARSETEWGTLRSYIRLQSTWQGVGDGPVAVDQAYIELGGFKMGYSESFWVDSGNGGRVELRLALLDRHVLRLPAARFDRLSLRLERLLRRSVARRRRSERRRLHA
jgi:hypothetical protein